MPKSPDAFRTISEVAEWLNTPAHVLRFWESKFTQVKPVKRAGGRRYYRPNDMLLLGGLKFLLHEEGMTIKGAQALLREKGVKHVGGLSIPVDQGADAPVEHQSPDNDVAENDPQPASGVAEDTESQAWELERDVSETQEIPPEFEDHSPVITTSEPQIFTATDLDGDTERSSDHFLRSAAQVIDNTAPPEPRREAPPVPGPKQSPAGPTRLNALVQTIRVHGARPESLARLKALRARMGDAA